MCVCEGAATELPRQHVSNMYYNGEVEAEMRDHMYPERMSWVFTKDADREIFMEKIYDERTKTMYAHNPSPLCPQKGIIHTSKH